MADDTPNPDEFTPEMVEELAAMERDSTIDFDARQRDDAGWLKTYVECPECQTPMARTMVESWTPIPTDADGVRRTKARFHAVCPDCHAMEANLTMYKEIRPTDEKHRRVTNTEADDED